MTYDEAIEWLLSFADFERSGRFQDRPDVAPMLALLERLGNPHLGRTTVHIAGSKGKGSVAAMVGSIKASDCPGCVIVYTSPHLYSFVERFGNGRRGEGGEDGFALFATEYLRPAVEKLQRELPERRLVTFDLLTAMAFLLADTTELQVLEVGLGGRVDSTNVFKSKDVAVITPISFEHTEILGSTIEQIAREKAAIITPGCTVVVAPQAYPEASALVQKFAEEAKAPLVDVSAVYRWRKISHTVRDQRVRIEGPREDIEADLPLLGRHQIENAATAIAAIDALLDRGIEIWLDMSYQEGITKGLANVRWPCRIEVVHEAPLVIVDGAHNRDSARRLAETLGEYFAADRVLFVIGCGSDKDIDGLAEELASLAVRVIAVRSEHPRAMDPQRIAEVFGRLNVDAEIVEKVPEAVDLAIADTSDGALICVAGSLFVAAEARAHLLG